MKKIILLSLAFVALFGFSACDEIEAPYNKAPLPVGDWTSFVNTKNLDSLIANTTQKVLIEDYTGFTCGNCPSAALIAKSLAEANPGKVFVMGVHAGSFAAPKGKHKYDFRTEAGTTFDEFFGISKIGNPNGMLNRTTINGSKVIGRDDWTSNVANILKVKPSLAFTDLKAQLSTDNKSIKVDCSLQYINVPNKNNKLAVFILEDSVVQYQLDYSKTPSDIDDYVHNHVLRASVNGTWGEAVKGGSSISRGEVLARTYTYSIPEGKDWRLNKLRIVAFVYDDTDKTILQVEEAEIK